MPLLDPMYTDCVPFEDAQPAKHVEMWQIHRERESLQERTVGEIYSRSGELSTEDLIAQLEITVEEFEVEEMASYLEDRGIVKNAYGKYEYPFRVVGSSPEIADVD